MAETPADRINNLKAINLEYERQLDNLKGKNQAEERAIVLSQQRANNEKLITELIKEQGEDVGKNAEQIDALIKANKC